MLDILLNLFMLVTSWAAAVWTNCSFQTKLTGCAAVVWQSVDRKTCILRLERRGQGIWGTTLCLWFLYMLAKRVPSFREGHQMQRSPTPGSWPTTGPWPVWNQATQAVGEHGHLCKAPLVQAVVTCTGAQSFLCMSSCCLRWCTKLPSQEWQASATCACLPATHRELSHLLPPVGPPTVKGWGPLI